jgi:RNA polymerase sigma-70 factor (ECF subfamily)
MTETSTLVHQARDGDRQALEKLVARFDRYVFGVALLTLGNRAEAQDAAQEALIKVTRGLRKYDGRAAFRTWLYRITINTCRDLLRRHARRRETALENEPVIGNNPWHTVVDQELQQATWRAIQTLEAPLREVVILRYYLDLPCAEIGEITETPTNTVYWRLHQARRQLEPLLLAEDALAEEIATRQKKEHTDEL